LQIDWTMPRLIAAVRSELNFTALSAFFRKLNDAASQTISVRTSSLIRGHLTDDGRSVRNRFQMGDRLLHDGIFGVTGFQAHSIRMTFAQRQVRKPVIVIRVDIKSCLILILSRVFFIRSRNT
jgi:hypothetical protein